MGQSHSWTVTLQGLSLPVEGIPLIQTLWAPYSDCVLCACTQWAITESPPVVQILN